MRWVKLQRWEIDDLLASAVKEWHREIYPQIDGEILGVEHNFSYLIDTMEWYGKQINVFGNGTIDLVTSTQMWDWKTASRKYSQKEKQKQDVQSTMYGGAVVAAGWHEWPLTFNFGVVVRGGAAQVVPVERDESHFNWMKRTIRPMIRQGLFVGLNEEWPMNDTHFLCSETWCPFWSVCRGCHAQ
jgi:hypothetical protein